MAYIIHAQKSYPIQNCFLVGTDPNCQLQIQDPEVSERHLRIENKPQGYFLRDLRSIQGTLVNNQKTDGAYLKEGDEVQIGSTKLIFSRQKEFFRGLGLSSKNEKWNDQLEVLGNVARTDFPVLILGSSGTGKEIMAEALHKKSSRSEGPFISVNCSALTETLVESELFGHIKGSFTGATADRKGAFEAARGGTLFLDEIGDLSYGLQAKLLRALENSEIRPVGSDRTILTDTRIVAATHQNLSEKIHCGQFRSDLYFRLNVVTVTPPVLKERMEDFEDLLYSFAKKYKVRFSFAAVQKLKAHPWPGNIRELKNTVARACTFFPGQQIEESHLERIIDRISFGNNVSSIPATQFPVIKEIERQMIVKRLVANHGNQRRTASDLGMPKSTLHDRLRYYSINPQEFKPKTPSELMA